VTELGKTSRKAALVLSLVAFIVPYEMEIEFSGPWDARIFHRLISSMVWAIETNGFQSQLGSSETTQLFFPHCCLSEFASVLLLINLFLVLLIILCLDGLIGHRITVYALILSVIFPPILSSLVSIFMEMGSIFLLPIPAIQLIGLYLLRNFKSIGH
jgi:hypothetical protein